MDMTQCRSVLPTVAVLLLACDGAGAPESNSTVRDSAGAPEALHTVRDSAGVRIVESPGPAWGDHSQWLVDTIPDLDLSSELDEGLFGAGSPHQLPDGRLVVFVQGDCEVRFYGQDGGFQGSSGGCGAGPGEFRASARIWPWTADSLVAFDPGRLTFLSGQGGLRYTVPLPSSKSMPLPRVIGPISGQAVAVVGVRDPGPGDPGALEISEVALGVIRHPWESVQIVGTFQGPVYHYFDFQGRLLRGELPFSGSASFAVGKDRVYVGLPDRNEIHVLGPSGALRQIFRRPLRPVEVTQADIDWLVERRLTEVHGPDDQRLVRQAFRDLRHAPEMPSFGVPVWTSGTEEGGPGLLPDSEGNLWVFEYYRPGHYENRFSVFSPDEAWLGSVALPDRFRPSQIGSGFLVGTWKDAWGFVHFRRFGLNKRGTDHNSSDA